MTPMPVQQEPRVPAGAISHRFLARLAPTFVYVMSTAARTGETTTGALKRRVRPRSSRSEGSMTCSFYGLLFDTRGGRRTATSWQQRAPRLAEPPSRGARAPCRDHDRPRTGRSLARGLRRPRLQPRDALAVA